ncbi:MAG: DUF1987 domain-containing protein [Bacteroidia bacterium]|nr:DUF1987 domain-containing protein [Bacteroidia bacterium]
MDVLSIAEAKSTPAIRFDLNAGQLDIKGRSIPENAPEFYQPLMKAIDEYGTNPQSETIVNFALVYFNTSSSKCLLRILTALSNINTKGTKVKINWYYDGSDDDQLETANDLESTSDLHFNYICVDENN